MALFDRVPTPPLEAIQWTGNNIDEVRAFGADVVFDDMLTLLCGVDGQQGYVTVPVGDWIAIGVPRHFYPIADSYFKATFIEHKE